MESDVNAPKLFLPANVNSLECRRRDTSFNIFSLSSYLPLTTPRCQEASDLFRISCTGKLRWRYSNQTWILDLASESALQTEKPMTLVPDML